MRRHKGLSTNTPPCAVLPCALRLVDLVADWLMPEVRTNPRQSLQETKHDAAQHGAGQGRAVHLWKIPKVYRDAARVQSNCYRRYYYCPTVLCLFHIKMSHLHSYTHNFD